MIHAEAQLHVTGLGASPELHIDDAPTVDMTGPVPGETSLDEELRAEGVDPEQLIRLAADAIFAGTARFQLELRAAHQQLGAARGRIADLESACRLHEASQREAPVAPEEEQLRAEVLAGLVRLAEADDDERGRAEALVERCGQWPGDTPSPMQAYAVIAGEILALRRGRVRARARAALLERRAENAEARERALEEELGRARGAAPAGVGGAHDSGEPEADCAPGQESLSFAPTDAGVGGAGQERAPASPPAQQDGAASGVADGAFGPAHAARLLEVVRERIERPFQCPILHTLDVGGGGVVGAAALGHNVDVDDERGCASLTPGGLVILPPSDRTAGVAASTVVIRGDEAREDAL